MAKVEKWRKFLDIGGHAGVLLTDISKAFDRIDHELLIAKLLMVLTLTRLNLFTLTLREENRGLR